MMREILFRGKTRITGNWIYGFYGENTTTKESQIVGKNDFCYSLVIPETVGQYTGLTDKNGTKIFEGDVVFDTIDRENASIIFDFGSYYVNNDNMHIRLGASMSMQVEVIGNIHDNPELLKGGEGDESRRIHKEKI